MTNKQNIQSSILNTALIEYIELKEFLDQYNGSLVELCQKLKGYNFYEDWKFFDLTYKSLTATIHEDNKKFILDSSFEIWSNEYEDEEMQDIILDEELGKKCYEIYSSSYYLDHDNTNTMACLEEFMQNEWQDCESREHYINKFKEQVGI